MTLLKNENEGGKKATWGLEANRLSFSEWRTVTAVGGNSPRALVPPLALHLIKKNFLNKSHSTRKMGKRILLARKQNKGNGRIERLLALGTAI